MTIINRPFAVSVCLQIAPQKFVLSSMTILFRHQNKSYSSARHSQAAAAFASSLPKLPVPPLLKTVEKFLSFAKPIQSHEEYERTVEVATKFAESAEAQELQNLLEKRAQTLPNWLTPWWLSVAYLRARTPLPVVTSPGITFPFFNYSGLDGQIDCAARIVQSALCYHHRILKDELKADLGPGGVPFDMSQYKLLFGTTRVPKQGQDLVRYGKDQPKWAQHILVTRNGHTFHVPIYDRQGQVLGLSQIRTQLKDVVAKSEQPKQYAVNIVSSDDRDTWAQVFHQLDKNSPAQVQIVLDSLFVLCLDRDFGHSFPLPEKPEDRNMAMALHGGGAEKNARNRWFDKTLQFFVNENGYGGITYEHTPAEGPPLSMLLDFICDQIDANMFEQDTKGDFSGPEELHFNLDSADIQTVKNAEQKLEKVIQNLEVNSLAFDHYGKSLPKRARLSPDSWIQLALQLTFFRLHRRHAPAYETGTLRKFNEGRTDTIRQPTMDSAMFVETFCAERGQDANAVSGMATLLEKAIGRHKQYAAEVMDGMGIDRHLLGLRLVAEENGRPVPQLLRTAEAYQRLMHFLLSTSQVPTRHVLPMGFGPSASDCYGVCYNPQEDRVYFTITAFNECQETSAERFARELEKALLDMRDLVDRAGRLGERAKM